jgi:hypothetical protein
MSVTDPAATAIKRFEELLDRTESLRTERLSFNEIRELGGLPYAYRASGTSAGSGRTR